MYYKIFLYHLTLASWLYDKLKILIWKIIHYGGLFVCAKFHGQIPIKSSIFYSFFFIAIFVTHYCKLKSTPIDNWIIDMCTNFPTLWKFKMLLTFNCTFPSLKMCCSEKCQIVTTFCLHYTMETPN
jgi:hypothetical protein